MNPAPIAWAAGLLPALVVHACYLISAQAEWVPWCLPYIEGCSSISKAARHGLANHLFKAVMLPSATLIAGFWWLCFIWLRQRGLTSASRAKWMRGLGVIGALFLVLYASFLGVDGEIYQWLRRYGVTVYFSFTVLAQMLLTSLIWPQDGIAPRFRRALMFLCAALLCLGLVSLPLQYLAEDRSAAINAVEWCYALLMTLGFPLVGLIWSSDGFRLTAELRNIK